MRRALAIGIVALAACEAAPASPPFALAFHAANDRGQALAGVAIAVAGREVGVTDARGDLVVEGGFAEGSAASLAARCPAGFLAAEMIESITFRRFQPISSAAPDAPLEVSLVCPRERRVAALVVRAGGRGGLPVLVDGARRAVTDESGIAHLALEVAPSDAVRVVLDTSGEPRLRPQKPQTTFTMGDVDDVWVMDQRFEAKREPTRRRRRSAPPPEPPKRPIRVN